MVERANFQFEGNDGSGVLSGEGYVNPEVARATGTAESPGPTPAGPAQTAGPTQKRKYTRRSTQTQTGVHLNCTAIEKLLISIHVSLAVGLQTPEMALDPVEAQQLAKAIDDVQACYNAVLNPVTQAWLNLMLTAGTIYGTRAVAIYMRRSNEKPKVGLTQPGQAPQQPQQPQQRGNGQTPQNADYGFGFNPLKIELPH